MNVSYNTHLFILIIGLQLLPDKKNPDCNGQKFGLWVFIIYCGSLFYERFVSYAFIYVN